MALWRANHLHTLNISSLGIELKRDRAESCMVGQKAAIQQQQLDWKTNMFCFSVIQSSSCSSWMQRDFFGEVLEGSFWLAGFPRTVPGQPPAFWEPAWPLVIELITSNPAINIPPIQCNASVWEKKVSKQMTLFTLLISTGHFTYGRQFFETKHPASPLNVFIISQLDRKLYWSIFHDQTVVPAGCSSYRWMEHLLWRSCCNNHNNLKAVFDCNICELNTAPFQRAELD